ncbi:MAG: hypothetical protein JRN20_11560 [Nitrososphaerota archaeon]|nr:hypothetical protein [Nitrososphaerota archaeon]
MIVARVALTRFPAAFVRVRGKNDRTREFRALIDPLSDYCIIPKPDAFWLGYPEAAQDDPITMPPNLTTIATNNGYAQAMLIKIREVDLNKSKLRNVDFLALDLQQVTGFDVVIGRNFLASLGLIVEMDYQNKEMKIKQEVSSS